MFWAFLIIIVLIGLLAYSLIEVRRRTRRMARSKTLDRVVRSRPLPDDSDGYRCPIHPHVRHGSPGRCPNCGQGLVRASDGSPRSTRQE